MATLVAAVALGVGAPPVALGVGAPPVAHAAAFGAIWELEAPYPAADASGNGRRLTVGPGVTFRPGAGAFDFAPGSGLLTATLPPPYGADFSVTVDVVLWGLGDRNIVQQGRYSPAGTQWKLELQGSRLVCSFKGSESAVGGVQAGSPPGFASAGTRHVITCSKTRDTLTLRVDGRVIATTRQPIGAITTPMPVSIGGKVACQVRCDHFLGRVFRVAIRPA